MAVRSVFQVGEKNAVRFVVMTEFVWRGGFGLGRSCENVAALHDSYHRMYPDKRLLEVSGRAESELGRSLSASKLMLKAPSGTENTVECFYQAGKVFEHGGPYTDLLDGPGSRAGKDERLSSSGALIGFELEGVRYPARPSTLFYEWLYIHALEQHPELADALMEYDGFTDITFRSERGSACGAQACAMYVTLRRLGLLREALQSAETYAELAYSRRMKTDAALSPIRRPAGEKSVKEPENRIADGCRVAHPSFGEGKVLGRTGEILTVNFGGTEKKLGSGWVLRNCLVCAG